MGGMRLHRRKCVAMTLLQGLWSWYIIRGIYKMFLPTSSDDSETMRKEKRR